MKIDYIELKNYRQYKRVKIQFTQPKKERNFTIIQGANGSGKTNLLNAVTWCLFGKELHFKEKYRGLPKINMGSFNELKPTETCEVEVKIQMKDGQGEKISFRRALTFRKSEDGKVSEIPDPHSNYSDGSTFEMMRQLKSDITNVEDPKFVLSMLIPESIEEYFFFDGERLNDYFRETSGDKIRESVFKISQLDLFERVIKHLKDRRKDFIPKDGQLSSEAEQLRTLIETVENSLENYKQDLRVKKYDKKRAGAKEKEYSEKLRTCEVPNVRELEEERQGINDLLDRIDSRLGDLEKEKLDYIIKISPVIYTFKSLVDAKEMIDAREEAGDIPPDYKKNFIKKLLKKGTCICGTPIKGEGNSERKCIEKLLQECSDISDISEELIREHASLNSLIEGLDDFRELQTKYGKRIKELDEERSEKSKRLKKIEEKIKGTDVGQIKRWEEKLEEYKEKKEELIEEITRRGIMIEQTEKKLKDYHDDLDKELKKEDRYKELRKILNFCDSSLEAANKIKGEIMEDVRKEIEEKTREQFFGLIWKKETYKDVKIDDEYNISVVDRSGLESIGSLSSGERQVLALSFMAALNSVSGFDVPIIIDTPLGRISKEPKKNIANNLPNYLEGKQVTMLVTEEEYTPEVREKLSKRVGKEFRINFKETKNGDLAEVVPY